MSPWLIRFTCRARNNHMGGVRKLGVPNSWMVYFMENPIWKWMRTGGSMAYFMENPIWKWMRTGIWRIPPWPNRNLRWRPRILLPTCPWSWDIFGNTEIHRARPPDLSACPGLILMYRFYKDVSHVELIIGESGLRPDPRASRTLWEPLSTPKYGKPLRDQQVSRYPLVNSQNYGKSMKITIFKSYVGLPEGKICFPRSL